MARCPARLATHPAGAVALQGMATIDERLERIDGRLERLTDAVEKQGVLLLAMDKNITLLTELAQRNSEMLIRGFTWRDEQFHELERRVAALEARP
jgi:hypothetical protein